MKEILKKCMVSLEISMSASVILLFLHCEVLYISTGFNQSSIKEGCCVLKIFRGFNDLWVNLQVMFN